ncbi:MAG: transporter permease subunit [Hydrocarboniphaga sp.]|uniref:ABC transporter permease subunit n=1 Tax=Hydrocarboniphaga sp. TaxID=2033016 RepID=UPI002603DB62|nr:ABC transporter permease subunit [Hydrocarboniphaga sp.]MDB5967666.1 transporter permease subunit [Hydrocarboniphaga sp.]
MTEATASDTPDRQPRSIVAGSAGYQPRYIKDRLAKVVVLIGGIGVIAALLLIFVYLLSEVAPLFEGAEFKARKAFPVPSDGSTSLYVSAEEQGEVGMRVGASGELNFFDLHSGVAREAVHLPIGDLQIKQVVDVAPERALLAAGLSDGSVLMFQQEYKVTYPNDKRLITPGILFPKGETPLAFMPQAPMHLAVRENDDSLMLVGSDPAGDVSLKAFEVTTSLMGDSSVTESPMQTFTPPVKPDLLLLEPGMHWLYVIDKAAGKIAFYRLNGSEVPQLVDVSEAGAAIVDAHYLAGGISIVSAQSDGRVSQWFPARRQGGKDDGKSYLAHIRDFELKDGAKPTVIGSEPRRRGFAVGDDQGHVSLFYATSGRLIHEEKMLEAPVRALAFNPRAQLLLALGDDGKLVASDVRNEHPEVSLRALWGKVWYESYDEPNLLWQSSSASADFEPKFSMAPLALGTLKGAFYAMIFAIPIAVLGAIFTANFMSPEMRQVVKPAVEVLAALPSVILGFLAGLWLAPFVESNLPGMFLALLLLPLSIPTFGYLWMRAPRAVRLRVPMGWEAALLMPVIAFVVWLCFLLAKPMEALLFGGNMQAWMDHTLGIGYDQRNALVVGIAMGVAVIPVIFSIAEDAIFSVPKHLSLGSLALGATPWQTLIGVVMPTASPGIFSAVMIGLGRAVGETMIVLMATGNTAVTNFSMFSGMRTLAANVAVEMPESEVGSTHFRLLFLSGLVLFLFTFFFNTVAEVVRTRLRRKYSSL